MGVKGRGGRPPKPLEFKIRDGTDRADRRTPNVPSPEHAAPEQPDNLSERAVVLWQEMAGLLGPEGRNVLTVADGRVLGVFAECIAQFEEKPSATMANQVRQFAGLFGLTPADRQRIPAIAPPEDGKKKLRQPGERPS